MKEIGKLYMYDNGQALVRFVWDGASRDGYVWSERRQVRLATYRRKRDLVAAYKRSDNQAGPYGCARLDL